MCCFSNFSIATGSLLFLAQLLLQSPSQKSSVTLWSEERPHSSQVLICFWARNHLAGRGNKAAAATINSFLIISVHRSVDHIAALSQRRGRRKLILDWYDDSVHFKMGQFYVKWSRRKFRAEFFVQGSI